MQRGIGLADSVIDVQTSRIRMQPRRGDVLRGSIDADNRRTAGRQRLAHQAGTATDVGNAQTLQRTDLASEALRDLFEHVAEPKLIDHVQWPHRPGTVPPGGGKSIEARHFVVANGAGRGCG